MVTPLGIDFCKAGLDVLFERSHVSANNQDLNKIVYYCLSPASPPEETLELAKQYKNKDVFIHLLYEKALLLHSGEASCAKHVQNTPFFSQQEMGCLVSDKDQFLKILNVLWSNDIRPAPSFWVPISRSLQSHYNKVFLTKQIDEAFFKSALAFFKDKKLPPLLGVSVFSSSIDVIHHVLKTPIKDQKKRPYGSGDGMGKNFSIDTYRKLIDQVDFEAVAMSNRMMMGRLLNNKIKEDSATGFVLVKKFCAQTNVDLLMLSKRIFNLGTSEEIASCAALLSACAEEYGEKCLTPSRRFVLHEKHKDFLSKELNGSVLWSASSPEIKDILVYLSAHEIRANIQDALHSTPPNPLKKRKM